LAERWKMKARNPCELCGYAFVLEEFTEDDDNLDRAQVFVVCKKCKIGHWMRFDNGEE
jgi:hypothetical protein